MMAKTAVGAKKPAKLELPSDWFVSGAKPDKYEGGLDPSVSHDGKPCLLLKNKDDIDATGEWSTLMTGTTPSEPGTRLRITMWVKTDSARWVAPWMRVDKGDSTVSFDNGCKRRIYNSVDWQQWSMTLDVPEGSTNIAYGVMLGGSGKVWIVEPELEVVTSEIDTTDCACMAGIAAQNKKSQAKRRKLLPARGWLDRLIYRTDAKYDVGIDPSESYKDQKAACVNIANAYNYESAELYQTMSCDGYRGKRIRLTVQLKSRKVKKGVFLVEILGPHGGTVALDDMGNRPLEGTHNWSEHTLVLDVPENAYEMKFGARVTGDGTMWFSSLALEKVDKTVALTDDYSMGCRGVWWQNLINTDFSEEEETKYRSQSCKLGTTAKGWLGWSTPGLNFEVGIDSSTRRNDKNSGCIKKVVKGSASDNAVLFQKFDAKVYRGKRVRLTAFSKTVGVTGECGLILLVMDAHQNCLFAQNTFDIDSYADHDWTKREIVVDVPSHAGVFMISMEVTGEGSAWINEPHFEVVGTDVPITVSSWKAKPKNFDLREVEA